MEQSEDSEVIEINQQKDLDRPVDPDFDERITRILDQFEEDFEQLS